MITRRQTGWLALALWCALIFATRVDVRFERTRIRPALGTQVAGDAPLALPLPDMSRLAGASSAVILRIRGASEPAVVSIALDGGAPFAQASVPANREVRVDAAADLPAGAGHRLTLRGDRPGWSVTYVELASVHGFTRGLVDFLIVPRGRPGNLPPWWLAVLVAAGLFWLRPRPEWPGTPHWRRIHRAGAAVVLVFFAGALFSALTPYRLLLSVKTFFLMTAVLYADPVAFAIRFVAPTMRRVALRVRPVAPHALVIVLVLWGVAQLYRPGTGFTSLILFGGAFEHTAMPAVRSTPHWIDRGAGYDGQFYAQLALDPLLRSQEIQRALDSPAYRGRRILGPWLAHTIGFGDPWRILQVYALLNVACWLGLAVVLLKWLPPGSGRPTLAWIGCLLSEGLLSSVRQSLPDGPSMLILALAVLAIERNRRWLAAGVMGVAGLARETNLLAAVALLPEQPSLRTLAVAVAQGLIAAAPLALWVWYLSSLGFAPGDAGARNFSAPLDACFGKWTVTFADLDRGGWSSAARLSLLSLVALTTQAVVLVAMGRSAWRSPWWRIGIVYALFMTVLGEAVWEGHPSATPRVVLPMTIAFNVLLPRVRWTWFVPLWILGNAGLLVGVDILKVPYLSEWAQWEWLKG